MIAIDSARHGVRLEWTQPRFVLRSTTTFIATDAHLALDLDGTDANFASNFPTGRSRSVSQELRFMSPAASPLEWTAGAIRAARSTTRAASTSCAP